jgi:hypothetical protein
MGIYADRVARGARRVRPEAEGFDRVADRYDRGRPEYPAEAVAQVVAALRLGPEARVIDLGAGTGKLTRALRLAGLRPIAIEPGVGLGTEFVRHFLRPHRVALIPRSQTGSVRSGIDESRKSRLPAVGRHRSRSLSRTEGSVPWSPLGRL